MATPVYFYMHGDLSSLCERTVNKTNKCMLIDSCPSLVVTCHISGNETRGAVGAVARCGGIAPTIAHGHDRVTAPPDTVYS